ncbi:MAG: cytochrome B [Rubrivivax sp.]
MAVHGTEMQELAHWWLAPLSGAALHTIEPWAYWHARVMVAAWALLLPAGALLARFGKVHSRSGWPQRLDDKRWWHGHRALQYSGMALTLLGLALAWNMGSRPGAVAQWHHLLGWVVVAMGGLQVLGGWLRGSKGGPTDRQMRGDHYDMTLRRRAFERQHKTTGWLSLLFAIAVIALGLTVSDAPRWMALVLLLWFALVFAAFASLQRTGRCSDTYQAIWGPDPVHPGNALRPSGWGVRRLVDGSSTGLASAIAQTGSKTLQAPHDHRP